MAEQERKIPPTDGLEMFVNQGGSISIVQWDRIEQDTVVITVELRDVETVRQWLSELLLEAAELEDEE